MMPKLFLSTFMLLASFMVSSPAFAYALIDLSPGSSAPDLVVAQEEEMGEVEAVEVSSKQRGHLLALVPVNLRIIVVAWADGRLEIDYPWYSFMTLSHREELETKLKVAVNNSRDRSFLGSVKAEGVSSEPKFTTAQAEAVKEGIEKVLAASDDEEEGE
jgi:hypothetical protein